MLPAWAVACGDTLGPGGVYTLTADLDCRESERALTLVDRVTLDLGGYTLFAAWPGVLIKGHGVSLEHGQIVGCDICVNATGTSHRLSRLTMAGDFHETALFMTDDTVLEDLTLRGSLLVVGDGNHLTRVIITHADPGLYVEGAGNVVREGLVSESQNGMIIIGARNVLRRNTMTQSVDSQLVVQGDHNVLLGNVVLTSPGSGIEVDGQGNRILRNMSLENYQDLVDRSGTCTANVWRANVAETASPPCLLDTSSPPPPEVAAKD
jgi:hypothetical protein